MQRIILRLIHNFSRVFSFCTPILKFVKNHNNIRVPKNFSETFHARNEINNINTSLSEYLSKQCEGIRTETTILKKFRAKYTSGNSKIPKDKITYYIDEDDIYDNSIRKSSQYKTLELYERKKDKIKHLSTKFYLKYLEESDEHKKIDVKNLCKKRCVNKANHIVELHKAMLEHQVETMSLTEEIFNDRPWPWVNLNIFSNGAEAFLEYSVGDTKFSKQNDECINCTNS